jgi:Family of unknown function (DUF5317)
MVFVNFVGAAFVVGLLVGGKPSRLADLELRRLPLVFVAIGLQVIAFPSGTLPWSMPTVPARVIWLCSYVLLIAFLYANRRYVGVRVGALGVACNLLAVLANGGLMPALPSALRGAGRHYDLHNNSIDRATPHLSWLVDRWSTPHWLPFGNVFSVGDVLIALGAALVVLLAMVVRPRSPQPAELPA